jgi:hypothetical protein
VRAVLASASFILSGGFVATASAVALPLLFEELPVSAVVVSGLLVPAALVHLAAKVQSAEGGRLELPETARAVTNVATLGLAMWARRIDRVATLDRARWEENWLDHLYVLEGADERIPKLEAYSQP